MNILDLLRKFSMSGQPAWLAARRFAHISDTTVKTHITHILQKLGLQSRVQAVVLAYEAGFATADVRQSNDRVERSTR